MKAISIVLFASLLGGAVVHPSFAVEAPTGKETVLHSFGKGTDGSNPLASLTTVNGILYGTTQWGGAGNGAYGTVFSIDPNTGVETVLHSFCSEQQCADGAFPDAGLTAVQGTLYGTTQSGGDATAHTLGSGVLFAIDPSTGAETVLYSFPCTKRKCNGRAPESPLLNVHGKLYGTTTAGGTGSNPRGTVFEFDLKTGKEKLLYTFCSQQDCADGEQDDEGAAAGLVELNGIVYGTTAYGGSGALVQCGTEYGCGVVFSLDPSTSTEKVLHSFCNQQGCTDGVIPAAGLTVVNGTLYGTTLGGGEGGSGTIFALDPDTGAETVLHSFTCVRRKCAGGDGPNGPLLNIKGKLYGTTRGGGAIGGGAAFALDPTTGAEKRLYSFGGDSDGATPYDGLIVMKSTLYGTTFGGGCGRHACGTVFSLKR